MKMPDTLYRKMAILLFILVFSLGVSFFWVMNYSSELYQQEVNQKLNLDLAGHLVDEAPLIADSKVNQDALKNLFHMLMVINPSIEIYLLDPQGRILAYSAPEGKVKRERIALTPLQKFLHTDHEVPLMGDDPRSLGNQKIFSAAPIRTDGKLQGYLYVILGGEAYDNIAGRMGNSHVLRGALWILLGSLALALLFGLGGFSWITRRLTALMQVIQAYSSEDSNAASQRYKEKTVGTASDEIDLLGRSFNQMADRIDQQVNELKRNDSLRREMIANISHDLRTPLTSLHGYIETLLFKDQDLDAVQRQQYLAIANKQSSQLIKLVSELFDLAKLDSCETLINVEAFSLAELVHDVVNKFKLRASEMDIQLVVKSSKSLPFAYGDIALIQRVLDNLIENALQHTPANGQIRVSLTADNKHISVEIADSGCGIPEEKLPYIFERFYRLDKSRNTNGEHAGLGLAIAKRILDLHQNAIWASSKHQQGSTFGFQVSVTANA
jgi:two-component system OmpR family sensor kinase